MATGTKHISPVEHALGIDWAWSCSYAFVYGLRDLVFPLYFSFCGVLHTKCSAWSLWSTHLHDQNIAQIIRGPNNPNLHWFWSAYLQIYNKPNFISLGEISKHAFCEWVSNSDLKRSISLVYHYFLIEHLAADWFGPVGPCFTSWNTQIGISALSMFPKVICSFYLHLMFLSNQYSVCNHC